MPESTTSFPQRLLISCGPIIAILSLLADESHGFATSRHFLTIPQVTCRRSTLAYIQQQFSPKYAFRCAERNFQLHGVRQLTTRDTEQGVNDAWDAQDDDGTDEDSASTLPLDGLERAWRYARKPLLSIGSKGATLSHGNSLRQLLEAHTVVKVKCHTRKFNGDLQAAFEHLKSLAEESGAPTGVECLQAREKDSIIMFALPGTKDRIDRGDFPPALEAPPTNGIRPSPTKLGE